MPSVVDTQPGPPALEALAREIAGRKAHDILAPVTVAPPSAVAGLGLRRLLGARPGGLVNVRFTPLPRVAELLGAPRLVAAGRRPLTPPLLTEAVRATLAAAPGRFAPVASHPATERAVARACTELRALPSEALRTLARSPATADVARLALATRERLAGYYDDHDLARAAVDEIAAGPAALADVGHLIVFLPRRLPPAHEALIEALGGAATLIVDRPAGGTAGGPDGDDIRLPAVHRIVTCADADDEVREALRGVAQRVAADPPVPLHRMAILHAAADPYARIAHQQLTAAGLPHNGPGVRTLGDTVAGAALAGLLRLPDGDFRRDDLLAWLTAAPILEDARQGREAPATRWDAVSRRAGIVGGERQWRDRLATFCAQLAERRAQAEHDGGDDPQAAERIEAELALAERLRVFVDELTAVTQPPADGRWSSLAAWACGLLDRYLGPELRHARWPEEEQDAYRAVRHAVERLGALDGLGSRASASTFRRAVEEELRAPASRTGTFGDGVFVAPVTAARGLQFDVVFVVGLAEGTLPSQVHDDVLVPDRERELTAVLPTRAERLAEQRTALADALHAGTERVVSWPRGDLRRGRSRLPSRWLLELAGALRGEPVFAAGLDELCADDTEPRVVEIPSFEAGVGTAPEPPSLLEYDLQSLLLWTAPPANGAAVDHYLAGASPRLAAGLEAVTSRTGPAFTRFDGNVAGGGTALPDGALLSATSLETYATCPFRYFLSSQLRLSAVEKPEDVVSLSALDKGTLVHQVLEDYVRTLLDGEDRSLDRLLALAEERFAEVEGKGLTGRPLLWDYEKSVIRRELAEVYRADTLEPLAVELTFGMEGAPPVTLSLPGGRRLAFRGKADRVDVDRERDELVVTDYKTGRASRQRDFEQDPVIRGTKLQLPLYALAARQAFPGHGRQVRARYWYATEKGNFTEVDVSLADGTVDRFEAVVRTIADGIRAGRFPARPGDPSWPNAFENCGWCAFDTLCQADRDRQWERKRTDHAVASYVALAEDPVPGEGKARTRG